MFAPSQINTLLVLVPNTKSKSPLYESNFNRSFAVNVPSGSTNTIRIRGLRFTEKEGGFASGFWDTSVSDVIKYLQTSSGEVVFDFKIKGTMQNPRFFPGPYVQQAIQRMAVDKISQMIQKSQGGGDTTTSGAAAGGGEQTDAEKVMGIIQGLMEQ